MQIPSILFVRSPKSSEVSLSQPVKESVDEAIGSIRNALSFASRTEHPLVITTLSKVLADLDAIELMDGIFAQAEERFNEKMRKGEDLFNP